MEKWKNYGWIFHLSWYLVDIMENKRKFRAAPDLKLMDQVRQVLRYHHYAYRTENLTVFLEGFSQLPDGTT